MKPILIALTLIALTAGIATTSRTALAADPAPGRPPDPTAASTTLGVQGLSDGEAAKIRRIVETQAQDLMSGNFDGYALSWAKQGVLLRGGEPRIAGRGAITDFAEANFPVGTRIRFGDWAVAGRGDLAVATGNATILLPGGNGEPRRVDQFTVLRRNADGRWLVQTAVWSFGGQG